MKNSRATLRYAKSLLELSKENECVDQCKSDMETVLNACNNSKELTLLLSSPIVKTDKKLAILNEIFTNLNPLSSAFITLITKKKREALLHSIAKRFLLVYNEDKGIESALVTTAIPLDDVMRNSIHDFIKKQGVDKVELKEKVNPKIIGGLILNLGDKQMDASVQRNINDLKQSFNKNLYIKDF